MKKIQDCRQLTNKRANVCYCGNFSNKHFLFFSMRKETISHHFYFTLCKLKHFEQGDANCMNYC